MGALLGPCTAALAKTGGDGLGPRPSQPSRANHCAPPLSSQYPLAGRLERCHRLLEVRRRVLRRHRHPARREKATQPEQLTNAPATRHVSPAPQQQRTPPRRLRQTPRPGTARQAAGASPALASHLMLGGRRRRSSLEYRPSASSTPSRARQSSTTRCSAASPASYCGEQGGAGVAAWWVRRRAGSGAGLANCHASSTPHCRLLHTPAGCRCPHRRTAARQGGVPAPLRRGGGPTPAPAHKQASVAATAAATAATGWPALLRLLLPHTSAACGSGLRARWMTGEMAAASPPTTDR